ncbi:hypothetical protein GCM10020219_035630 [Nonomuraea dietziae]
MSQMPTATMRTDLADLAGRQGIGASIRYQGPDGWERAELILRTLAPTAFSAGRHLSSHPALGCKAMPAAVLETQDGQRHAEHPGRGFRKHVNLLKSRNRYEP